MCRTLPVCSTAAIAAGVERVHYTAEQRSLQTAAPVLG
jgi:hypothetical protein